jgi:general secretion pathway protein J
MRSKPNSAGFTLLEILVALIIFSLMSVMAYRGLTTVLQTRAHLAQENQKWRAVAMLFARMEKDLSMLAKRPIRDPGDLSAAALIGKTNASGEQDALLMFTRMGLPEQANALAGPLRFGYRLRNDSVEQLIWPVLDAAPRSVPSVNVLLEQVTSLELHYLDRLGAWHATWPLAGNSPDLPSAVTLELKSKERITRLFALPVLQ